MDRATPRVAAAAAVPADQIEPVLALSREILDRLKERKLVDVQQRLDTIFERFDVARWIGGEPRQVATVLDAVGRALSRNCQWRVDGPEESCRFTLIDLALGRPEGFKPDEPYYPNQDVGDLDLETVARFSMYRGISTLHRRRYEWAEMEFGTAARDGRRLRDRDLEMVARFYLAVCARKLGRPHDIRRHLESAQALIAGDAPREAAMSIHIAWLNCSEGRFADVATSLRKAQVVLSQQTSDHAAVAHAQSLEARLARRRCDYVTAKTLIGQAIDGYARVSAHHRALSRCYANLALTEILLSEQAKDQAARTAHLDDADKALDEADKIFRGRHYARDTGPEIVNLRALVHHHRGNYETAIAIADRSYDSAAARKDYVEMSTARIVKCQCILDRATAMGLTQPVDPLSLVAEHNLARVCADEAEMASRHLQGTHGRREARAFIWKGFVALRAPFLDKELATHCKTRAYDLLPAPKEEAGYVWTEWKRLEQAIADFADGRLTIPYVFSIASDSLAGKTYDELIAAFDEFLICATYWNNHTSREVLEALDMPRVRHWDAVERCKTKGLIPPEVLHARKGGRRGHHKATRSS